MYLLTARKANGEQIQLFVQGTIDGNKIGFKHNEPICLVKEISEGVVQVVGAPVGKVRLEVNGNSSMPIFDFTDEAFKTSINYDAATGRSFMDGGAWRLLNVNYTDHKVGTRVPANIANKIMVYNGAKTPFVMMPPQSSLTAIFGKFSTKEVDNKEPKDTKDSTQTNTFVFP